MKVQVVDSRVFSAMFRVKCCVGALSPSREDVLVSLAGQTSGFTGLALSLTSFRAPGVFTQAVRATLAGSRRLYIRTFKFSEYHGH